MIGTGQAAASRADDNVGRNAGPPPSSRGGPNQPAADPVRRVGRNWALPESLNGVRGTSIVRTIRVICYRDRFALLPPSSGGATEIFGFSDGELTRATMELATAVRDRIRDWGASLPGGRWHPRLNVDVMPGADERFSQLRMLMSGSGVEVNRVATGGRPTR